MSFIFHILRVMLALALAAAPLWAQTQPPTRQLVPLHQEGTGPGGHPRLVGDLSVEGAVELGTAQRLELALARTELQRMRAELEMARAEGRLKVALGTYVTFQNIPMIYQGAPGVEPSFLTQVPDESALDLNVMAMLPLFTGGRFEARVAAAEAAERRALAMVALELRETAREARKRYQDVLLALEQVDIANWELEQQQEALRLARASLEAGRVARYVVLRSAAEVAQARQRLNQARARLTMAENDLKVALGVAVTSSFQYSEAVPPRSPASGLEDDFASAIADRPDLVAARYGVEEAGRRIDEAGAAYAPQLYLVGMGEGMWRRPFSSGPFESGASGGLVLSVPLLDGGERRAGVQRAEAERQGRELELERLELVVTGQVSNARAALEAALENLALAEEVVADADEQLRITRLRFEVGRGIYLEVLDALAAAARARLNRAEAASEAGSAYADWLYAVGRLTER